VENKGNIIYKIDATHVKLKRCNTALGKKLSVISVMCAEIANILYIYETI